VVIRDGNRLSPVNIVDFKIWHGGVAMGSLRACDECGASADTLFGIGIHQRGDPGRWACRSCVLDPARVIATMDRRGDTLHGARITRELDAVAAVARHLDAKHRADSDYGTPLGSLPLPAAYSHVLAALDRCARVDDEFATAITELRERYAQAASFTPKQTLLVHWRLSTNGVTHDPGCFVVSTRSDKEIAQMRGFDDWRKKKIAPYLSWAQRGRFGF
jgi:hypothetical protein